MRLLASTDIALRLLILLAQRPTDQPQSVEALSRALGGLSRNHLHKIVQDLAALGMVRTLRGVGGGVCLAQKPEQIRIGALMRALEEDQAMVECFRADGGACTFNPGCRLRGMLGRARDGFYRMLDESTLADCL
jgi:Rrf2 family transcriptional regulator, nitric oxide-sensitive transcriptional repressor